MENAADALKIAFAIFVLVTAITITFSLVSQAKSTADVVLFYGDKTNFYDYGDSDSENRRVPVTEVISTLYRYYKESICVTVVLRESDPDYEGNRTFDLKNSFSDTNAIESELAKYVDDYLKDIPADKMFSEEFVEAPISGIYVTGEDDTELTITSGGKKVYVTYTLKT